MVLSSTARWNYTTADGDWQPFTLGVSAALEAEYYLWKTGCEGHDGTTKVRTGALEHTVDFAAMRRWTPGDLIAPGQVKREEVYLASDVSILQAELDFLRVRLAELEQQGADRDGGRPFDLPAAGISSTSWRTQDSKRHVPPTPGGLTANSGTSWKTAASIGSGIFTLSQNSLESIAEWVFALRSPPSLPQGKAYERVPVPQGDPRRLWLEDYIQSSMQPHRRSYNSDEWCPAPEINILKICEVMNEGVNAAYWSELLQLRSTRHGHRQKTEELEHAICLRTDGSGPKLNETLLFHGCRWETVFSILREGFDSRLGGTNVGAAFGIGTYFSTVASKADLYSQRWTDWERKPPNCEVPESLRCMLIARVALGEIHEQLTADSTLRRPPVGPDGVRCDSVLGVPRSRGGCVDYDEFIVYKPGQATPQFVVEYEHAPECRCRACWATPV